MKTQSLTTEERIAELEKWATACIQADDVTSTDILVAIAFELRALRLMLRDEIREAAWPLKLARSGHGMPIVDHDASPFEQPPAPAGIPYGKDSEEAQAIERVIAEADAERKASDA